MKKISPRKLKNIHNIISKYNQENNSIIYDIPSLMKYCIENDLKTALKEEVKRIDDEQINSIFKSMNFNIYLEQLKNNKNSVKIKFSYNEDLEDIHNSYYR